MSLQKIEKAILTAQRIAHWEAYLIEYDHKKNPNEYVCYAFHFEPKELLNNIVNSMSSNFFNKVKNQERVLEYTAQNPKGTIEKLSLNSSLIHKTWASLLNHINTSDDTCKLKDISANAFIFVGNYQDENGNDKNLYFLTQKNPVLSFKKRTPIFVSRHNTVVEAQEPMIQFGRCCDILITDHTLYSVNNNFESIFNIEYSHKIVCREHLAELETADLIDDMESYKTFAVSGKNSKKFITYDAQIVAKLQKQEYKDLLKKELRIPVNPATHKFDLSKPQNARNFTLAICGKTKLNMFDKGVCEVPSSVPISFS